MRHRPLTAKIADHGAGIVGVDSSADMIERARATYREIRFVHADARSPKFEQAFDAVFSSVTLHSISEQKRVVSSITDVLELGGRFVAELDGRENTAAIRGIVAEALAARGRDVPEPF